MDTMTMDYRKIQLAQFILGLTDSSLLDKIASVVGENNHTITHEPCHYTLAEVQERLRVCENEAIAGNGISIEELEAESLNWI